MRRRRSTAPCGARFHARTHVAHPAAACQVRKMFFARRRHAQKLSIALTCDTSQQEEVEGLSNNEAFFEWHVDFLSFQL